MFWLNVLTELKSRGVQDILIVCVDGLTDFPEAIETAYPKTQVQLYTFHKAMDLGSHLADKRHRKGIIADALHIFEVATETEARKRLRGFVDKWAQKELKAYGTFTKTWMPVLFI